jgi:hypothetical protein
MKTRTFRILVALLILLQIGSIVSIALSMRQPAQNSEQVQLTRLLLDMHNFHVTLGDYELAVAAQEGIDRGPFDSVRNAIEVDLDELIKTNEKQPDRVEILERQKKLMEVTAQVVELLRDTASQREHGDRFAVLITMLKGTRKLDKIAHKMHDDLQTLVETMPNQQAKGPSPLLIAALVMAGISAVIGAVLIAKGSSAMSY